VGIVNANANDCQYVSRGGAVIYGFASVIMSKRVSM
jgi:hypothetical protein